MANTETKLVSLETIDHFHARGMRQLHAHVLGFAGKRRVFRQEIWATKDDRLLVRFQCPTESDYNESYEICGLRVSELSKTDLDTAEIEFVDGWPGWAPQCFRDSWELWFSSVI